MKCRTCHTLLPDDAWYCHACGNAQHAAGAQAHAHEAQAGAGGARAGAARAHGYDYAAFISYRHLPADRKAALDVQRAIETYRLPKSVSSGALAGGVGGVSSSAPGGVSTDEANDRLGVGEAADARKGARTLGKCFRDEDELAASASLPANISDALARSRCLIVICSPSTPDSLWIQREIETFAQMHGRDRIFAVLIDGTSAESIPATLRMRTVVEPDGTTRQVSDSPLAADLRPGARKRASAEKLRIIAAVAGCPFDQLRQRSRVRRRNRIVAGFLIAAALAFVLAFLAFQAFQNDRDAQVSESRRLAAQSQLLLEQGDRYSAIETALEALSQRGSERPLTTEAQEALEDALGLNPHPSTLWTAGYALRTEHPMTLLATTLTHEQDQEATKASAIAVGEEGGFFAVSDDEGAVTTYDIRTGRLLARCETPADAQPLAGGLYPRTLATAGDLLVVSNSADPGAVACFDGKTGRVAWSRSNATFAAVDTSMGQSLAHMTQPRAEGGFTALVADVAAGSIIAAHDFGGARVLPAHSGALVTAGASAADCFCAFGDTLAWARLDTSKARFAKLAHPVATSICYGDGVLVVASASEMPTDGVVRDYAVEAFDDKLNPLWKHEGAFTSEMIADGNYVTLLSGEPAIWGFTLESKGVAISAGRSALVLDAATGMPALDSATGAPVLDRAFDQTIVAMTPISDEQSGLDKTFIACSNGTIAQKDLSGTAQDREGDEGRLALPFPIRWAHIAVLEDCVVALAIPADANDRIVAFRTDLTYGPSGEHGYSLEELIARADAELAEAGR